VERTNIPVQQQPSSVIGTFVTFSPDETIALAKEFARGLDVGDILALYGELGAGKTQFVKGVCLGLGIEEVVASPSFILMNEYKGSRNGKGSFSVFHFDFYRINSLNEIHDLGLEEYFSGRGICVIEWADVARSLLPQNRYDVTLRFLDDPNTREVTIEKVGDS